MKACQLLHEIAAARPAFRAGFDPAELPSNGIYLLFEEGEAGHGGKRIVRVGTHRGQNNLAKRIREHLFTPNKDRSVFRKHIGRSLLAKAGENTEQWEIDLTTKAAREKYAGKVDAGWVAGAEQKVSAYMTENFSFVVVPAATIAARLAAEAGMLSLLAQCPECGPSQSWLGLHHPNKIIRNSGLWNVQGLKSTPYESAAIEALFKV